MRFQRVVAEFVAALTGLVLVAGCTSPPPEPEPLPEPTRSSAASPSPSLSPSITPPTMPPKAEGTSPAAAKAFARYYIDLVNYAMATGSTSDLRAVSARGCASCEAVAGNIEEIYESGGRIDSGGWRVETLQVLGAADEAILVSLGVYLETEVVVSADGGRETHEGRQQPMNMRLIRSDGFKVKELELVS